ncbi:Na/Pi cotransporter family protein, partial [Candidatus Epulonipiscium viviparus]|uniref:Na/Pi cotransporter family protein n=1 Tax=Candidatus Epulonipiscium viviparus TaxID=420336 RepID=UPI00016C030D
SSKSAGNKMKSLIGALTNNRILGVLVGALVTAVVQSSSATTVMIVGFVNAGLMSLTQAVGVIMGANIGTTVTAWIVSLGEWVDFLSPSTIAPLLVAIGVTISMITKDQKIKYIAQIVFGFGALFMGLDMMSGAVKPLRELQEIKDLFITLGSNPILGILTGALVTAVIQSSSASVGILQALAIAALVPWNTAIYIILGQNIGTTITAMLSSIGANTNAKRAAVIHLLFNIIGSILFGIIAIVAFQFITPALGQTLISTTEISIVHSVFNILNTLLLFPFAALLVKLATKIVPDSVTDFEATPEINIHLDTRILETPSFAVESTAKEVYAFGKIARTNLQHAFAAILTGDEEKATHVIEVEKKINAMQHELNQYLVKLSNAALSIDETDTVNKLFHNVSDIERVGDHAENIAELTLSLIKSNATFSASAAEELVSMTDLVLETYSTALKAFTTNNVELAKTVYEFEDQVDKMEIRFRKRHIKRLSEEKCNPLAGIVFIDVLSNLERISDHSTNLVDSILDQDFVDDEL